MRKHGRKRETVQWWRKRENVQSVPIRGSRSKIFTRTHVLEPPKTAYNHKHTSLDSEIGEGKATGEEIDKRQWRQTSFGVLHA